MTITKRTLNVDFKGLYNLRRDFECRKNVDFVAFNDDQLVANSIGSKKLFVEPIFELNLLLNQ